MYRAPALPSPKALRRLAIWNRKLPSSTVTSGHTLDIRSFLLTTSFGVEISAIKMSSARAPSSTGTPSLVRSLSLTNKLQGPNDNWSWACSDAVAMGLSEPPLLGILSHGRSPAPWGATLCHQAATLRPGTVDRHL